MAVLGNDVLAIDDDGRVTAMLADSNDDAAHPHAPFTVDDLTRLPDDGRRYELFDGSLLASPAPTFVHQLVAMHLQVALYSAVPEGCVPIDTVNVKVDEENFLIPDLAVVRAGDDENADTLMFRPSEVVLAVEIVSHSSRSRDRILEPSSPARSPSPWTRPTGPGAGERGERLLTAHRVIEAVIAPLYGYGRDLVGRLLGDAQ